MRFLTEDLEVMCSEAGGPPGRPWVAMIRHRPTESYVEGAGGSQKDAFLRAMEMLREEVTRRYDLEIYRALFPVSGVSAS